MLFMAGQSPNSLRQDELSDYAYVGPFGGVQSEVPLDKINRSGFAEVQNLLLRKAGAELVPAFIPLGKQPLTGIEIIQLIGEINALSANYPPGLISSLSSVGSASPIMGIADFFTVNGTRVFVVMTPTGMFQWTGGQWLQVPGTLTGSTSQFFSWDVVGYKLYFSQQKDVVQVWDGITTSFAAASGSAVPGKYLCELDFHLLVANCVPLGVNAPNAIFWSGAGDGTDWTSFSSGSDNLYNGLGPINGLARIYQAGYAFQQWGITQILPTGNGLSPFQFVTMGSKAKGSILPYGVASFGEVVACYVGKDNIYLFDGTESNPIGSRPIDGNRMLGARRRIFTDLYNANLSNITGFINTSSNGQDYGSYWLLIPSLNKAWVYHFDEGNWTQVFFNPGQLQGPAGVFTGNNYGAPEIIQLVGTIAAQSWTFASLTNATPLDTMAIADANAKTVSLLSWGQPSSLPTSGSINKTDGWYVRSGQLNFDDSRRNHSIKKVRGLFIDGGRITVNLRITNEFGQQATASDTYGTGSGVTITIVFALSGAGISGKYLTWELSGPQGVGFGMSELTPVFDVGGEVQNNR